MNWLDTIASFATAVGVGVAAWQIWIGRKQAMTSFEDSFDRQYRELSMKIPVDALIGRGSPDKVEDNTREAIFNYLDLCNEQIYLRKRKRISHARWKEWCDGIKNNLEKPVFRGVWNEIREEAPEEFSYLMTLEEMECGSDPVSWGD